MSCEGAGDCTDACAHMFFHPVCRSGQGGNVQVNLLDLAQHLLKFFDKVRTLGHAQTRVAFARYVSAPHFVTKLFIYCVVRPALSAAQLRSTDPLSSANARRYGASTKAVSNRKHGRRKQPPNPKAPFHRPKKKALGKLKLAFSPKNRKRTLFQVWRWA